METKKGKMIVKVEAENENNKAHTQNIVSLNKLDRAFKNSLLSYAIYEKNKSWFEPWAQIKSRNPNSNIPADKMIETEGFFTATSRAHDRAFATVVASTFMPVELSLKVKDFHKSEDYLYNFDSEHKNGIYKAMGNLSAACAMKSKNSDGTYTLHMSFRGTDSDAQPFIKIFQKAYLDMAAYYESFKPFEKACLEYAKDSRNNITKIEVSGHSLGGAMVQHFFRSKDLEKANLSQKIEGITFGSPHALSNTLYAFIPAIRHVLKRRNFKAMMNTVFNTLCGQSLVDDFINKDSRITQYQHSGDLVPKVAGLLMTKTGSELITLPDVASKEMIVDHLLTNSDKSYYAQHYRDLNKPEVKFKTFKQMVATAVDTVFKNPAQVVLRVLQTVYHDQARYCINIENQAEKLMLKDENTGERRLIFYKTDHHPSITKYNNACMDIGIVKKGAKSLAGEKVSFNEHIQVDNKLLNVDFKSKIITGLRAIMQNTSSSSILKH